MRVLSAVLAFVRLLGALGCVAVGLLWSRRWATRRFRRRLSSQGIPPEVAGALTRGYRDMVSFPLREWIANKGA